MLRLSTVTQPSASKYYVTSSLSDLSQFREVREQVVLKINSYTSISRKFRLNSMLVSLNITGFSNYLLGIIGEPLNPFPPQAAALHGFWAAGQVLLTLIFM